MGNEFFADLRNVELLFVVLLVGRRVLNLTILSRIHILTLQIFPHTIFMLFEGLQSVILALSEEPVQTLLVWIKLLFARS